MRELISPRPGSAKAIEAGCTCPVLDNQHGRGYGGDWTLYGWIIRGDCPVHGSCFEEFRGVKAANNHQ